MLFFKKYFLKMIFLSKVASRIMDELLENIFPSECCIILTDTEGVFFLH